MIKGIGVDIIEISRIKEAIERFSDHFLIRVYTQKEIAYCSRRKSYGFAELAVRFAAKEAYSKALGVGLLGLGRGGHGVKLTEVEVVNDSLGKPQIARDGKILEKTHLSLSHCREYAIATVYVEE